MNEKQVLETKNNKREASGTKSNERGEPENKKQ